MCPNWSNDDYLYGDYYSPKFSWYRLALHECDPIKRRQQGKKCASKRKINDYFTETLSNIMIQTIKPDLTTYDTKPIKKYTQDVEYSAQPFKELL